jgi:hypothetical protein
LELLDLAGDGIYEQKALHIVGATWQIKEKVHHIAILVDSHFDKLRVRTALHCCFKRFV